MKKKKKKEMIRYTSIFFLIWGVSMFWIGFHNTDQAVNTIRITDCNEESYAEKTLGGLTWTIEEAYLNGLNMMITGLIISIIGGVMLK